MEKTIISVLGKDTKGIIAEVTGYLAGTNCNILRISQNIVDGYFNMLIVADTSEATVSMPQAKEALKEIGENLGVQILLQKEQIFEKMHRI